MKVVLLKPRKKLGNIGDIVDVKNGFGRNFLIPQKIASRATKENLEFFESKKHELIALNDNLAAESKIVAEKLSGQDFTFIAQCSDDGRLFGSVTSKDIAAKASECAQEKIDPSKVNLVAPLKAIGVYEISLQLHVEVTANVIINIARSENEARDALKNFKNGPVVEATEDVLESGIENLMASTEVAE